MFHCILPDKVEEYRKALKDKKIDVLKLMDPKMSSEARTKIFEEFAGKDAKVMDTLFEEKLILKNRLQGLKNFINKTAELKQYSQAGKDELARSMAELKAKQQERILSPKEHEAFLNDLADKMIGTHVSREVAGKIYELGQKADAVKNVNPKLTGVSDEYFQAKKELNDYVNSQMPVDVHTSILKDVSTLLRNNLIFNPSTPIKGITSQLENSLLDAVTRRFSTGKATGLNNDLAIQSVKEGLQTWKKTNLGTSGMESLDDTHTFNKGEDFKVPADANIGSKSALKVAHVLNVMTKWSNKIVIDWEHNAAFTAFHQLNFADAINMASSDMAKGEGLKGPEAKVRARELMTDALRIEPKTDEGIALRKEAQAQAARITSTNDNVLASLAMGAKRMMNNVGKNYFGGFPIGDFIEPMAKIPATVVANGLDNAGAGIPVMLKDYFQGRTKIASEDLNTRLEGMAQLRSSVQRFMRIGGTLGVSALIASQFNQDDFHTDKFGTHFVRIGGRWINTEYMSVISPALAGMMMVRGMNGGGFGEKALTYIHGSLRDLKKVPGFDELEKLRQAVLGTDIAKDVGHYLSDMSISRLLPAFLKQGLHGVTVDTQVPFVHGSPDHPFMRLLFGASGVRSDEQFNEDEVKKNWEFSKSKELTQFKEQSSPEDFKKANDEVNKRVGKFLMEVKKDSTYKDLTEEEKKQVLSKNKHAIMEQVLNEYGFQYSREKKQPLPDFSEYQGEQQ
jgi:hypothetical protein